MNIDQLTKEFKTFEEMKAFAEAQFKQILNLSKKIKEIEEEKSHLKKLLQDGVPVIQKIESNGLTLVSNQLNLMIESDSKTIAQVQLKLLKDMSYDRELTLEEAKRVELFHKILNVTEEKPKTFKADAKTLNDKELLALVGHSDDASGN